MDSTDIILCKLLMLNSRSSYRELAEKLGLSVNAVHRRIQELKAMGVIHNFTAKPTLIALNAMSVYVFGVSKANFVMDAREKLVRDGRTYWLGLASGNYVYVGAHLRHFEELDSFSTFVTKELEIEEPTIGILYAPGYGGTGVQQNERTLYPLDLQIIRSLNNDSRKQISEVAEELGISAKTVRRRLTRMTENNLIELSMEFYPDKTDDIITIFNLKVRGTVDKNSIGPLLMKKYPLKTIYAITFSNLPSTVQYMTWTNSMKEVLDLFESLKAEGCFASIVPNILYTGYIFKTWIDKLIESGQ